MAVLSATYTCDSCNRRLTVQDGWLHCPFCGRAFVVSIVVERRQQAKEAAAYSMRWLVGSFVVGFSFWVVGAFLSLVVLRQAVDVLMSTEGGVILFAVGILYLVLGPMLVTMLVGGRKMRKKFPSFDQ